MVASLAVQGLNINSIYHLIIPYFILPLNFFVGEAKFATIGDIFFLSVNEYNVKPDTIPQFGLRFYNFFWF